MDDGDLRQLRAVFAAIVTGIVLVGVVVVVLETAADIDGGLPTTAVGALALLGGLVAVAAAPRVGPALDRSSEERLAATYHSRFFLRLALSEVPALLAFVAFVLTGSGWLYTPGLLLSLYAFSSGAAPGPVPSTDG